MDVQITVTFTDAQVEAARKELVDYSEGQYTESELHEFLIENWLSRDTDPFWRAKNVEVT
jgi:hypothetical protein